MNFVFEQHRETIFNLQKMIFGLTIKKKTDILILYDINVQMSERRRQYDIGGAKTTYAGVFMNKITNTKAPKRNYVLELWRFIFCIMVLGFHFFSKIDFRLFQGISVSSFSFWFPDTLSAAFISDNWKTRILEIA